MAVNQTVTIQTTGTWADSDAALEDIVTKTGGISILNFLESKKSSGNLSGSIVFDGTNKLTVTRVWSDSAWEEYKLEATGRSTLEGLGWTITETNDA
jgi:hypothetical protein